MLGKGTLSFIDNHVDTTTGTIALKGTFANADERLWPGEFVNARLILSVRHNAVTVPEQTVMAGPNGAMSMSSARTTRCSGATCSLPAGRTGSR